MNPSAEEELKRNIDKLMQSFAPNQTVLNEIMRLVTEWHAQQTAMLQLTEQGRQAYKQRQKNQQ